jgi:hypothetical protein
MGGDILVPFGQCVVVALFTSSVAMWVVVVAVLLPVFVVKCATNAIREVRYARWACVRCGYPNLAGRVCSECGMGRESTFRGWTPSRRTLLLVIAVSFVAAGAASAFADMTLRWDERRFMAELADVQPGTWIQRECLIGSDLIRRADGSFARDD